MVNLKKTAGVKFLYKLTDRKLNGSGGVFFRIISWLWIKYGLLKLSEWDESLFYYTLLVALSICKN